MGGTASGRRSADLLARTGLPTVVVAGNHDVEIRRETDLCPALLAATRRRRCGRRLRRAAPAPVAVAAPLHVVDLPGIRVVTVDSSRETHSTGSLRPVLADLLDALAESDRPALVCVHHCFDRWPVPTKYPGGIPWPESPQVLAAIRRVKPDVVVTTGHTHRNRARRLGPLVVSEVGSTKDYPGVWAGYAVYEGGIVQVVRRITWPDAMGWTEYTRRALGGLWRWYAPGHAGRPLLQPSVAAGPASAPPPGSPRREQRPHAGSRVRAHGPIGRSSRRARRGAPRPPRRPRRRRSGTGRRGGPRTTRASSATWRSS